MKALPFHPLAEIFPLIEGEEFDALVADIKANGVQYPIWIYQGQILDGRNRYRASLVAGVDCRVQQYTGSDPVAHVVSLIERLVPGPYIELFARSARKGWDAWGNQAPSIPDDLSIPPLLRRAP